MTFHKMTRLQNAMLIGGTPRSKNPICNSNSNRVSQPETFNGIEFHTDVTVERLKVIGL